MCSSSACGSRTGWTLSVAGSRGSDPVGRTARRTTPSTRWPRRQVTFWMRYVSGSNRSSRALLIALTASGLRLPSFAAHGRPSPSCIGVERQPAVGALEGEQVASELIPLCQDHLRHPPADYY